MKYSEFNYPFYYDGMQGVFNTYSGAIVLFESDDENIFTTSLSNLKDVYITQFKKLGIIIDESIDERKLLQAKRQTRIDHLDKPIFRILTTYKCNANCFYCYEGKNTEESLNIETADKIIKFIEEHLDSKKQACVQWFGGEPLINHSIISYISSRLRELDIELYTSMITNGSLFTEELVQIAVKEWNLRGVQITLDGYGKIHDRRKKYNNLLNSFERTINNIHLLIENNIKVSIRINYDYSNIESVYELIKYLGEEFRNRDCLFCYAHHLFDNYNYLNNNHRLIDTYKINRIIVEEGLSNYKFLFKHLNRRNGLCGFCSKNSYVIEPDGSLIKCAADKQSKYGSVEGVDNQSLLNKWTSALLEERCNNCIFEPLCQGGCRTSHFNNYSTSCLIDSESLNELLHDYVKYSMNKKYI